MRRFSWSLLRGPGVGRAHDVRQAPATRTPSGALNDACRPSAAAAGGTLRPAGDRRRGDRLRQRPRRRHARVAGGAGGARRLRRAAPAAAAPSWCTAGCATWSRRSGVSTVPSSGWCGRRCGSARRCWSWPRTWCTSWRSSCPCTSCGSSPTTASASTCTTAWRAATRCGAPSSCRASRRTSGSRTCARRYAARDRHASCAAGWSTTTASSTTRA